MGQNILVAIMGILVCVAGIWAWRIDHCGSDDRQHINESEEQQHEKN